MHKREFALYCSGARHCTAVDVRFAASANRARGAAARGPIAFLMPLKLFHFLNRARRGHRRARTAKAPLEDFDLDHQLPYDAAKRCPRRDSSTNFDSGIASAAGAVGRRAS